ncbi:MAG: acetyl-CoA carboxylase carboxyl transferase subunit alpha [Opitutaceae bacterium]|mgnify:CR=1 FL=1|nr:acetyl-CoA carboxylase carboxyl transferase subunit alpha [Opitutaceae bacterium]|tara:strand:+ start:1177 stop:2172 length:996 start_codon:yes stop_codon:yes gene_type:complete
MEQFEFILDFEKPLRDLEKQLRALETVSRENRVDVQSEIDSILEKIEATKRTIYKNLTPWQKVQIARHPKRLYSLDYIRSLINNFQELHGDRRFRDDPAMICGTGRLEGHPVTVIAQQKGRKTKHKILRNFGMPHPEGYRKALRCMEMAEKFGIPILCLIDTAGAAPGIGSEERHVAEAIAVNIRQMSRLEVPIIAAVIGEGGSGGALGIGVADKVLVFENSYYATISPEGCAAILWKDRTHAKDAAEAMKLDAQELIKFGVADEIVEEPLGGTHRDPEKSVENLRDAILRNLQDLKGQDTDTLLENRYQKYRNIGVYLEAENFESASRIG